MASHLQIFVNGSPIVDNDGNPIAFINDAQGQADANAAALALITPVDAVVKWRAALLVGDQLHTASGVSEEIFNQNPIASVGIDEEAETIHLNLTLNGVGILHQQVYGLWPVRSLLSAQLQEYTEYVAA